MSVIKLGDIVPEGWRILTMTEGRQIKEHLGNIVGDDTTVAFVQGRLDGHAYGNQFHSEHGPETDEIFIIKKRETDKRR